MRLGIIGFEASGKTTLFNALTRSTLPTGTLDGGARMEVHSAAVDVPDQRLTALSDFARPKKTTFAKVTYADIGGLSVGAGKQGLPGPLTNTLSQMDGMLVVLRAFEDEAVPHPLVEVNPSRDLAALHAEFLLHDMVTVERRLAKLQEEHDRGGRERAVVEREIELFQRAMDNLEQDKPLRELQGSTREAGVLRGFGLLSLTPTLVIVNLGEGQAMPALTGLRPGQPVLGLQSELEMEIAQLSPEEETIYLREYGLSEPGRERVIRASYEHLGLISFFTLNEEEARAWTLPAGSTCLDAAGTVHTDLARGFIRAEVIHWHELIEVGGFVEARKGGKLRIEGKEGIVTDGDVIHVRFNV